MPKGRYSSTDRTRDNDATNFFVWVTDKNKFGSSPVLMSKKDAIRQYPELAFGIKDLEVGDEYKTRYAHFIRSARVPSPQAVKKATRHDRARAFRRFAEQGVGRRRAAEMLYAASMATPVESYYASDNED
jgi:hypothetical protein